MAANEAADEQKPEAYPLGYVEEIWGVKNEAGGHFRRRYSETGMNCLIHAPKLPGLRL
jgi:hypothetical protein